MTSKVPDKCPLQDGVYLVEMSGPVQHAGFEVINGTIQHAGWPLHDWLRRDPMQCIRTARRIGDIGIPVTFPIGRPKPLYDQQRETGHH